MNRVWVIKDHEGNYVESNCFTPTDEGVLYSSYTGIAGGFSWYDNKLTARKDLEKIKKINEKYSFNIEFYLEYIKFNEIPFGKINIKEMPNKKLNFCAK